MEKTKLQISMLGSFNIKYGNSILSDSDNRARKVWPLLAYLLFNYRRAVPQQELIDLLWADSANPDSVVKTTLHRLRSMLNQLDEHLGYRLIICSDGTYGWNRDWTIKLDINDFDNLLGKIAKTENDADKIKLALQAIALYRGDLLPKHKAEWLQPIAADYRQKYIRLVRQCLSLLHQAGRYNEAIEIGRAARTFAPYDDEICYQMLLCMQSLGQNREIIEFYEEFCDEYMTKCDRLPSEEIRSLYRQATHSTNNCAQPLNVLIEQLKEPATQTPRSDGALLCDYVFFRDAYRAEARFAASGDTQIHIGLISIATQPNEDGRRKSPTARLQDIICQNLRNCDIVARCAAGQFIIMLPQTSYEEASMLLNNIIKAFYRQYPGFTAELLSSVEAIQPAV